MPASPSRRRPQRSTYCFTVARPPARPSTNSATAAGRFAAASRQFTPPVTAPRRRHAAADRHAAAEVRRRRGGGSTMRSGPQQAHVPRHHQQVPRQLGQAPAPRQFVVDTQPASSVTRITTLSRNSARRHDVHQQTA